MKPSIGFVGAGRVATALAVRLHEQGYRITGITSRSPESARKLAARLQRPVSDRYPQADILFLTVPDDALQAVKQDLMQHKVANAVVHTSGVYGQEVLHPLPRIGCLHPLYPFKPDTQLRGDEGIFVAVEASDEELETQLFDIARAIGGLPGRIQPGQKALYHAAAVMASNYLVTLFASALSLMQTAGIDEGLAQGALYGLVRGAAENLKTTSPAQALTGPIARGDTATVQQHLTALAGLDTLYLYRVLGFQTALLAPDLDDSTRQTLLDLLTQ